MPYTEVLILAVTRMRGGVCIAGMTTEPDATTGLRWMRPTRDFGHVLLGDITTREGTVLRPFDVVLFNCIGARADPPHVEDCVVDFVRNRPRIDRRLEGPRRADFLARYLDRNPDEVLRDHRRSLCLLEPDWVKGTFRLDEYTGKYDARLGFGFRGSIYQSSHAKGGLPVTDIKWRALGRDWLPNQGGWTEFDAGDLEARFGIQKIYLAIGLSRSYQGRLWPLVIGVHTVPDYDATLDYDDL
jgi:hypothetical protein